MVIISAALFGFAFGWWRATERQGNQLDKLQYGAAHGICFAILAFVAVLIVVRLGLV
ncbi:hypothetical protein [Halovulum sp. GXIMD14793]